MDRNRLQHVCGLQGFGASGDVCHACRIEAGVRFIMGPGGDEGTRFCTCNEYPHRPDCGSDDILERSK